MSLIPDSLHGVVIVVALVIPGIVYAAIRTSLQGFVAHDRSGTGRIIQAVMVSVLLDAAYLAVFGWIPGISATATSWLPNSPAILGLVVLALGVVVPAVIAYLIHGQARWVPATLRRISVLAPLPVDALAETLPSGRVSKLRYWLEPNTAYRKEPTAWDAIAPLQADMWIRVLTANGRWVGGWSTSETFFSSYPEAKDLYIPKAWRMGEDGEFLQAATASAGIWLPLEGAQLVEWQYDEPEPTTIESTVGREGTR
jgi:hypothetical protein